MVALFGFDFFAGTSGGSLIHYHIQFTDPVKVTAVAELKVAFSIDFICIDHLTGYNCAIASRKNTLVTIRNIHSDSPVKSDQSLSLSDRAEEIRHCAFFTADSDFLMVITNCEAMVYALKDCTARSLCSCPDIHAMWLLPSSGSLAIVVRSESVELRDLRSGAAPPVSECLLCTKRLTLRREVVTRGGG
jgi:hypothetical protein